MTERATAAPDTLPDPGELCAVSVPLPDARADGGRVAPAADRGAVAPAADGGRLVGGRARTVAGIGVAAVLPLPHGLEDVGGRDAVVSWLAAVERRTPDGAPLPGGIVALGSLPFDRAAPAELVVPRTTYCQGADGRRWVIRVGRPEEVGLRAGDAGTGEAPPEWRAREDGSSGILSDGSGSGGSGVEAGPLIEVPTPAGYAAAVGAVLDGIRRGEVEKVVLARMVEAAVTGPLRPSTVLDRLWGGRGAFMPYAMPVPGGRLVGASPELVVSRLGRAVTSHALAGTVSLAGGAGAEAIARLLASAKDRAEHRFVVDAVAQALATRCETVAVPDDPSVVALGTDARLGTLVRATLGPGPAPDARCRPADSALDLVALLHPTPAVGGVPTPAAAAMIAALEPAPRGHWAGVVGWLDGDGDGEWILAIRNALLGEGTVRAHAGAGIVRGSDPASELAETTVKLRPVLDALLPGWGAAL